MREIRLSGSGEGAVLSRPISSGSAPDDPRKANYSQSVAPTALVSGSIPVPGVALGAARQRCGRVPPGTL